MGSIIVAVVFIGMIILGHCIISFFEFRAQKKRLVELYTKENGYYSLNEELCYRAGIEDALNTFQIQVKGVNR